MLASDSVPYDSNLKFCPRYPGITTNIVKVIPGGEVWDKKGGRTEEPGRGRGMLKPAGGREGETQAMFSCCWTESAQAWREARVPVSDVSAL